MASQSTEPKKTSSLANQQKATRLTDTIEVQAVFVVVVCVLAIAMVLATRRTGKPLDKIMLPATSELIQPLHAPMTPAAAWTIAATTPTDSHLLV